MSREVKRVPMDFALKIGRIWPGYLYNGKPDNDEDFEWWYDHERHDPPAGEGWQMWETTTEGSPISPVFDSPEKLARWLADTNASAFGRMTATYDEWMAMIGVGSSRGSILVTNGEIKSGVAGVSK